MKEIVIISGKGGTGKTSVTASFTVLGGKELVAADCDVDASDMHLLLKPDFEKSYDFYSGELAVIDQDLCSFCEACYEVCRFDAIETKQGFMDINEINCEGCAYCSRVCPEKAIKMQEQNVGNWFVSNIKTGSKMVHARLGIGAENSGKLVAKVKKEAKIIAENRGAEYILVDGSPGIGCPVISSLSGADYVVLVTEPTVSGFHDLKRVHQVVESFKIPGSCIINKCDINPEITNLIKQYLSDNKLQLLAELPYDETFTKAMTFEKTIVEFGESSIKDKIQSSWNNLKIILAKETSS